MPIVTLTSKGQMTIPKKIRDALKLNSKDKIVVVPENGHALLYPLNASDILDIGGSFNIQRKKKPMNFKKVRERTKRIVTENIIKEMKR